MKLIHRAAAVAAPVALAFGTLAAAPAQAAPTAPQDAAPTVPVFDMAENCPQPAPGEDLTDQICVGLIVSSGSMKLGGLTQEITKPIRTYVKMVPGPNGEAVTDKVVMKADPMDVPGGVLGVLGLPNIPFLSDLPLFQIQAQPQYTGGFTFELPNAGLSMKIKLTNPLFGDSCTIGSDDDAVDLKLDADMDSLEIVDAGAATIAQPLIAKANAADTTFAVPGTSGCGLLGGIIDWAAGIPSASGQNSASFTTYVALGLYSSGAAKSAAAAPIKQLRALAKR
ncbi:hypothetical protein [Actinomadura atramentaria]|uniref:hypothetical protein n=1 Tax=Actinomadura atramentaria TaxID=1990 RepID=UPI000373D05E|nr:hypothetical protein [Actinomadura atramentaria]